MTGARAARIDITPLRVSRDLRLLFVGGAVSFLGSFLTVVAMPYQAYRLGRSTMWNQSIPDSLRGRLAGVELLSYSSGPTLGDVESGLVESLAGLRTSIVSGGIACVAGTVLVAAALPAFWNYRASEGRCLREAVAVT